MEIFELEDKIKNYSNMIYRLAFSMLKNKDDSEDVYQEVIIKFCKHSEEFIDEEHEKAWLIRVTVNQCKSLLRLTWYKNRVEIDEDIPQLDKEKDDIYYAVSELPVKYRTVIHLFYYEQYKISEIANILKEKESTIKSQLMRARNLLKNKIVGGVAIE
ncbi:MAG TPA: sigma-70 family RNA polymerase sigma factor [Clostridia bacterium]|nr:sigma-70 family RNA polymerase sigma factor [Clostridia bacterium]